MPRPRPEILVLALAILALSAGPARTAQMVAPPGSRPKDFAFLKHDGVYHIFYLRDRLDVPESTATDFGHAVSTDLWHWTHLPPVLPVRPDSWDRTQVWAPSIVERDGVFSMFYTGVSSTAGGQPWQSLGVATSTDLLVWNRGDVPVYACPQVPWTVCDSTRLGNAFRDPFVMPDPAAAGQWLLYYVTYPAADSGGMVVGVARSGGDFTQWADAGPLWITNRQWTYDSVIESPHLFEHAGLWYLLFTTEAGEPISWCTSPDPVGAPEAWTARGRLASMLGTTTSYWAGTEHLGDGPHDYLAWYYGDHVEIMRMVWNDDGTFGLVEPERVMVTGMAWDRGSVPENEVATLSIVATTADGTRIVTLAGYQVNRDGSETQVSLDALGLPDQVWLKSDTTRVPWTATKLPGMHGSDTLRLHLRIVDLPIGAPVLAVTQGHGSPPPRSNDVTENPIVQFRRLGSSTGLGAELLVELRADAQADVEVYDATGRRVRNLAHRVLPRGASLLSWDGRDAAGTTVCSGVYFARLSMRGYSGALRLVQLR